MLKVIASMSHIVAIDLTIPPPSPTLVEGLSPGTMSSQETFLGSISFEEISVSNYRLSSYALAVVVAVAAPVVPGHEKHLLR